MILFFEQTIRTAASSFVFCAAGMLWRSAMVSRVLRRRDAPLRLHSGRAVGRSMPGSTWVSADSLPLRLRYAPLSVRTRRERARVAERGLSRLRCSPDPLPRSETAARLRPLDVLRTTLRNLRTGSAPLAPIGSPLLNQDRRTKWDTSN